jgi:hypothetical protein
MLLSLLFSAFIGPAHATGYDADFYHDRYGLADPYIKKVDNHGDGYEPLYGTRNFREVLKGVMYRGGANNAFHRDHPRGNSNPLPEDGLQNLCAEGFKVSVYLYATNYGTASPSKNCGSIRGQNRLDYLQINPNTRNKEILALVHAAILDPEQGPVYAHCWNGWHASGQISAMALMQFCGWSNARALQYWEANIDGVNGPEYDPVRKRIRDFVPYADLNVDAATRARICPQ